VDDAETLASFFAVMQDADVRSRILAYHDRSDGGLFAAVCEMMFAGRAGATLQLEAWPHACPPARLLFNEELGALLQVRRVDADAVRDAFESAGVPCRSIGSVTTGGMLRVMNGEEELLCERRVDLHRAWSETSFELQRLRDHPECAQQEYDRILDEADPGLHAKLTFDPDEDVAAPYIARGARPKVAILREQGINGQVEMAAAFDRAGFDAVDVHMTDIIAGRVTLGGYQGFAAGGGFSYGDVLGAGEGWAKSILFNARARDEFAAFFQRMDTFALGACNGCQMMSNLHELIPGAEAWPHFVRNKSEQFEARFVMVEVLPTPSIFFTGMAGSRIPISIAHGEGYAEFADAQAFELVQPLVAVRYVDNYGRATSAYPYNPSCSPQGITGVTTPDGRFSILMPHPERVYRTIQNSWHPAEWGEDAPWLRMFRNARKWVG
jgi:phosphoribosylformylglycinamidine synthase